MAVKRVAGAPRVIAVGGSKGGIGKSMIAINCAIRMAEDGKKVVLIDLDLGGASIHLYLGITALKKDVNDYVTNRVATLDELMVPTKYGPFFIGGDSSRLGSNNIDYVRKMKLLRAVRDLDADYVIMDLGGDATYNILDFFLSADDSIVVTTCDPASYLNAYNFIKVALYRRLKRMFGPELGYGEKRNILLENLIHGFVMQTNGTGMKSVHDLLERTGDEFPAYGALVSRVVHDFEPYLLVNRNNNAALVDNIVKRIQDVSERVLSLKVNHIGTIGYHEEVEASARELYPAVARNPRGDFALEIARVTDRFLGDS